MPTGLPVWDLASAVDTGQPDAESALSALRDELADLTTLYDRHGIAGGPQLPPDPNLATVFDLLLERTDAAMRRERLISLYHAGLCWAGGDDAEAASAAYLKAQQQLAPAAVLRARLETWVPRLPARWLANRSPNAAEHRLWLQRCHADQSRGLPATEEALLARLDSTSGATAWVRLYEDSAARLTARSADDHVPVTLLAATAARTPTGRARVHRDAAAAWARMAPVAAGCLNAILGQEWILAERRGWADLLDLRLHREGVQRQTFELAHEATDDLLTGLRRFARTKAGLLGTDVLPYWEIGAPLPDEPRWTWTTATDVLIEAFTECDPELGRLAATAVGNGWIDAAPRPGKRTTALCLPMRDRESRILLNFDGSADSILRLAHELGHAYHHANQAEQTEWQRTCPLFLRETAAMAAEQAVLHATAPRPADRTHLRGAWLARVFRTCAIGLARFRFEEHVARRRRDGPLTETELCTLAASTQRIVYGDAIEASTVPGHAWISHPHLYSSRFNSIPYHLARVAAAAAFPAGAAPHLPAFLASTGLSTPAELFANHGGDLADTAFWEAGVRAIVAQIEQFAAAGAMTTNHAPAPADSGGAR